MKSSFKVIIQVNLIETYNLLHSVLLTLFCQSVILPLKISKMENSSNEKKKLDDEPVCLTYMGDYRNEKRHGNGISEHKDGSIYDGEWRCNLRNGFGFMCHPDGSSYEGEWKNNLKHGFGRYIYSNGDIYEGQWYDGKKHGIGTYVHLKNDCSFYGTWREGQRIGPAEIRTKNYRFHTMWMDTKPTGLAAFTFKCNTMMTGYLHTGNSDENICCANDFKWYTKAILKYDRSKLPNQPTLQFGDYSDSESEIGLEDEC